MSSDFATFWIRVEADASDAITVIDRARGQLQLMQNKARLLDINIKRSVTAGVAALSSLAAVGFAAFDLLGIAIDEVLKATIQLILSYATQLALIASSTSVINPIYAGILATAAATLQARAIQLQAQGAADAKASLDKARNLMFTVTQSLVIITRS